jgi:hypothetical protein
LAIINQITANPTNNYSFVYNSAIFGVEKNYDIDYDKIGKMCVVSDLDKYTFMYHNAHEYINGQIAELICGQPELYFCRLQGWTPERFFESMPDFFIDVFLDDPTPDGKFTKDVTKKRFKIDPRLFLELDSAGWFIPYIRGPAEARGPSRSNLDGAYGCPIGTSIIVGNKFLTQYALEVKLFMPDKQDRSNFEVHYQVNEKPDDGGLWSLWLIIPFLLLVLAVVVVGCYAVIKKRYHEENADSDSQFGEGSDEGDDQEMEFEKARVNKVSSIGQRTTSLRESGFADLERRSWPRKSEAGRERGDIKI